MARFQRYCVFRAVIDVSALKAIRKATWVYDSAGVVFDRKSKVLQMGR